MKFLNPGLPPDAARAGQLKALVLDWAGTTVDFGSVAPARTLQRVFAQAGIQLTEPEIRRDMGLPKKDHIARILGLPRVSAAWRALRGRAPLEADVDEVYRIFIPQQLSCLEEYSAVIPGVPDSVLEFRARGLKIGSTTGYTREMLDLLVHLAAKQRYSPDCSISPEDVGAGRPAPFMMYECAVRLRVFPLASIAKVGDTPADIVEGLNAGAWAIGVAGTGNGVGVSHKEFHALSENERRSRVQAARSELQDAGAHYVVETLAELVPVLDEIDARLAAAAGFPRASSEGV
jgi:phosphonoacetaldehyde hydrolase